MCGVMEFTSVILSSQIRDDFLGRVYLHFDLEDAESLYYFEKVRPLEWAGPQSHTPGGTCTCLNMVLPSSCL